MLYRMSENRFQEIGETSLGEEGVWERQLQEILRDQPEVIEGGLFIVAEEYGNWADSGRRIDLLGIGEDRNLVVVELKRGDSGEHMELQAIRYAAMAANMTLEQIVDAHRQYLQVRDVHEDAQERIHQFLDVGDGVTEPQVATERPRILLVSEDFSKELTISVLWLNDAGLDIRCVRLRVHSHGDELLIDVDQVIPLPEAHDYLVKVRDRAEESQRRRGSSRRYIAGTDDFEAAIADAHEAHQKDLRKLLKWARSIEDAGFTRLYTGSGGSDISLSPRLPSERSGLVAIFIRGSGRVPSLSFYRNVFERRIPSVIPRLEELLGFELGKGKTTKDFSDPILDLVTQAYKEANAAQVTEQR